MAKAKHWLINKQGIEWWHILIVAGILSLVFLLPFREENLDVYDVEWYFMDHQGNIYDPTQVDEMGGFGYTNNPERLEIANLVGTNMLIHPPHGGSTNAVMTVLEFPKSKIELIHQNNCGEEIENDGVEIQTDNSLETLYFEGKEYITTKVVVAPLTSNKCDWVWFKGYRRLSIAEHFYTKWFGGRDIIIPAQPFSVVELG